MFSWGLGPTQIVRRGQMCTANLRTKILDFRGFDSSRFILILRGGILRPIGHFPEIQSQRILAGRILVGRWAYGVLAASSERDAGVGKAELRLIPVILQKCYQYDCYPYFGYSQDWV